MDTDALRAGLGAVGGIAALGLAAATLGSSPADGVGTGGSGGSDAVRGGARRPATAAGEPLSPSPDLVAGILLVAVLVVVGWAVWTLENRRRRLVGAAVGAAGVVALVALLSQLGDGSLPVVSASPPGAISLSPADDQGSGGGGGVPLAVLAGVGALLVAAVAVLLASDSTATDRDTEDDTAAAVAAAAGRGADRIERAPATDNEVYRTWREMTRLLGDDEAATPREFVDRATAAGIDREDAAALTDIFEAVRYGGREASPAREQDAVAVLRRIERTYRSDGHRDAAESGGSE